MQDLAYEAPGEGTWLLDATHFQRPMCRFAFESFRAGMIRGFAEGNARYGLMLDHMEPAAVHGFVYMRQAMFGADGAATPVQMQERMTTSARAFEQRLWREDLHRWDEVDRPAAVAEHRRIQDVDPAALDDDGLAGHLARCRAHVEAMHYLHHKYTAGSTIAVGDFLAFAQQWTGAPSGELMELVRGSTPISIGFAAAEQDAAAAAIRAGATATAVLSATDPPADILERLCADPGAGAPVSAYLDAVRYRSVGYDVGDATAGEMPAMLVAALRAAADGAAATPVDEARLASIRATVPREHLAEFDDRLAEARLMNRLRDERGAYSDGWGTGLARRAVLEAGRRLRDRDLLVDAEHAVDADAGELAALLRGGSGPAPDTVAARYVWRTTHTTEDAPAWLGAVPQPPPPPDVLPEPARRGAAAVGLAMMNLFGVPDTPNSETVLHGLPVNDGIYEGPACVVDDAADFARVRSGDVLVARMTSPYFNVVLPLLGAIVTDRGGQLCHAAIVAREYGIPGIVGTREATRTIIDGARVRVDGRTGEVRLLG